MKVRKFLLENDKGQLFDMNNLKESCILISPSELGASYKSDFLLLGNTFIEDNRTIEQKNPSGTIYFKNYDKCKEFIDFIESAKELKFVYIIPFENEEKKYYRDVSIREFQKTEKHSRMLACPIVFNGLSLWYEKKEIIYTISRNEQELRWTYKWASRFKSYNIRSIAFNNVGHVEAPLYLELQGYLKNPSIAVYVNGKEIYNLSIPITLNEYEKLLYSTADNNMYLYKEETDGSMTNLFTNEYIDISKNNIFKLPKGVSEVRLTADNEILKGKLTILEQFKAV